MVAIREVTIKDGLAYVDLTRGYVAVIDACDAPLVAGRNWYAQISKRSVYAARKEGAKTVLMHRVILGSECAEEVDHEDGDGLNNRRSNLRAATVGQNQYNQRLKSTNTSGVKGVTWRPKNKKWQVAIRADGKTRYVGYFRNLEDAAAAYAAASANLHGSFGRADQKVVDSSKNICKTRCA